jgi:hypothetical protein
MQVSTRTTGVAVGALLVHEDHDPIRAVRQVYPFAARLMCSCADSNSLQLPGWSISRKARTYTLRRS